jgi:hypothetical protein
MGVFSPSEISGVGTTFRPLVNVLPGMNSERALEKKHDFELN